MVCHLRVFMSRQRAGIRGTQGMEEHDEAQNSDRRGGRADDRRLGFCAGPDIAPRRRSDYRDRTSPDARISPGGAVARGPSIVVPTAPPAPQSEIPPPAPSPTYVWEPGRWSWNGVQYLWNPGKYVERPTVSATYVPGHWEQYANGWVWYDGRWDYSGSGSSTPPVR